MIATVTDEIEIQECQKKLSQLLAKKLTNQGKFPFGSPFGTFERHTHYNDKIWWYYVKEKGTTIFNHVNYFGFMPLSTNQNNVEDFVATIPLTGINRQNQGVFVKDDLNQEYLLMHRGKFHRRTKKDFYNFFKGNKIEVYDGNRIETLYYIANINREDKILSDIINFMNEVKNFKNAFPIKK